MENPLLFALLAYHRKFISREQLLEATAAWMTSPDMDLGQLLLDGKYVLPDQHASIGKLIRDWEKTHSTAQAAEMSKELRDTMVALRRAGAKRDAPGPAESRDAKYVLGIELGRGGLGRVVEALDKELGRKVALKLLLEDAPQEMMERFRWEAKITGRLEHPNIVPVHEIGALPSREFFLCMKRIFGRDMSDVIREASHDMGPVSVVPGSRPKKPGTGRWNFRRLVEAFRDVCRAIAYAHSMGVIHRDLKPANVMLGDFGEVLVVDWGLARIIGEEDRPSQFRRATSSRQHRPMKKIASKEETTALTMEGDILGTPSYMPPEQALGRLQEIDERSDVYSLGATLYEILAGRPPFDGPTPQDVLDQVVGKVLPRPSTVRACPPELEAICLKAMAWKQPDRYVTVKALQFDVEAYLEGTKELERRQRMAEEQVARARREVETWRRLTAEAARTAAAAAAARKAHEPHDAAGKRRPTWEMEDRAAALEREAVEAFSEANESLSSALALLPEHADARRLKAEIFWEKFLEAEGAGAPAILYRRTAEAYNDGTLDESIKGDGTLTVRPTAYRCGCLKDGRDVAPAELKVTGYHPWSGRRVDGRQTEFCPDLERTEPSRLRVHAATCRPAPLDGAEAWAFRYEDIDRLRIPVTPAGAPSGAPAPAEALDALFGDSPFRPRGPGVHVGRLPVSARRWPMGSWLLVVTAPGRVPVRRPFVVGRRASVELEIVLFEPAETPPGFLAVQSGRFQSETDTGNPSDRDVVSVSDEALEAFFLGRHPVTCREYAEFLNDLAATEPEAAARHRPRAGSDAAYWPMVEGRVHVPTSLWLDSMDEKTTPPFLAFHNTRATWREDWPVLSVGWKDCVSWAAWATRRTGWLVTLPHMVQWEWAARGADGRVFPWGDYGNASLTNVNNSHPEGGQPVPVDDFPTDESPWGFRQMAGNAHQKCLNDPGPLYAHWRAQRGGSWSRTISFSRISYHQGSPIPQLNYATGFRAAAVVRLDD